MSGDGKTYAEFSILFYHRSSFMCTSRELIKMKKHYENKQTQQPTNKTIMLNQQSSH